MIVQAVGLAVDSLDPTRADLSIKVREAMEQAVHQCVAEGHDLDGPILKYRVHEARLRALAEAGVTD